MRLTVGLSGSAAAAGDLEATTVAEIHEVLDATCEAFADEIRRSIDYYHSQEHDGPIASLLLSGEGALTRNMCEYLCSRPAPAGRHGQSAAVHRREQVEARASRSSS